MNRMSFNFVADKRFVFSGKIRKKQSDSSLRAIGAFNSKHHPDLLVRKHLTWGHKCQSKLINRVFSAGLWFFSDLPLLLRRRLSALAPVFRSGKVSRSEHTADVFAFCSHSRAAISSHLSLALPLDTSERIWLVGGDDTLVVRMVPFL